MKIVRIPSAWSTWTYAGRQYRRAERGIEVYFDGLGWRLSNTSFVKGS